MTISLKYNVERNPVISIVKDGVVIDKILFIGDPHLGRRFTTGVPSHRTGEREEFVFSQFKRLLQLNDPLITKIVIVGDLFDKFIVTPTVVYEAFKVLSQVKPEVDVYIIPGNHDLSKDTSKISSFQLLTALLDSVKNTYVIQKSESYPMYYNNAQDVLYLYFDCYDPFTSCTVAEDLDSLSKKGLVISVGHWDSLSILDSGYTPHQDILTHSSLVVSGHEHSYKEYIYPFDTSKSKVLFTGSMQPYSHAEDPDSDIYVTIKEKDLNKYDLAKSFQYKCLRIECCPLFVLTENIDCFSLVYKIIEEEKKETEIETESVNVDNYNQTLLTWVESKEDFSPSIKQELSELLKTKGYLS